MLLKAGPWDDLARAEGQRLFDVAQLDLWASLQSALEPTLDRAGLKANVDKEQNDFGDLIKAHVIFLIRRDGAGYAAVTASLETLQTAVESAFHCKPQQTVDDIVTLYGHACDIAAEFNEVPLITFI